MEQSLSYLHFKFTKVNSAPSFIKTNVYRISAWFFTPNMECVESDLIYLSPDYFKTGHEKFEVFRSYCTRYYNSTAYWNFRWPSYCCVEQLVIPSRRELTCATWTTVALLDIPCK